MDLPVRLTPQKTRTSANIDPRAHSAAEYKKIRSELADNAERDRFDQYYFAKIEKRIDELNKERELKEPWSATKFLDELRSLDFTDNAKLSDFDEATHCRIVHPAPRPIILGQDDEYYYCLWSSYCSPRLSVFEHTRPPKPGESIHEQSLPSIYEFKPLPRAARSVKSIPPLEQDLRFGFGSLCAFTKSGKEGDRQVISTPFMVVYNPRQRDVWLIFNPVDEQTFGDFVMEEWSKEPNRIMRLQPVNYLLPSQEHLEEFDVVKLFDPDRVFEPGDTLEEKNAHKLGPDERRLFGSGMMGSAARKYLFA